MRKYLTNHNITIILLLVATYFSIFYHLGTDKIMLWDEGTYAVNAYEMYLHGNYLVKYYNGVPEMFATNPPLVCYFQVLCFKLFGPGELAVRLPSGLAALGIVLLFIRFAIKEKLGMDFATYAVLFLISTKGYVTYHVTRNGDLDSVLIFFITGSVIYFYKLLEYEKIKYLLVFSAFILLGFFTKGIACLLVVPSFIIYAILKNKILYLLKIKQLYVCIFVIILLIFSYYGLRELKTPGYISFMLQSEIGRWYTDGAVHNHPWYFFIQQMYDRDFKYFIYLIIGLIPFWFILPKEHFFRKYGTIWLLSFVCFITVISSSKTKLEWYEAPAYPMLSIFGALGLKSIISYVNFPRLTNYLAKSAFLIFIFALPFSEIIYANQNPEISWHDIHFGEALKRYHKLKNVPRKFEMLTAGYNGHALFYKMLYNDKFNYEINIRDITDNIGIVPNKVYMFTHPSIPPYLRDNFNYEVYMDSGGMMVVKILSYKNINKVN